MRLFAKILVYGLLIPAILFLCYEGIAIGEYLMTVGWLLLMSPVILVALVFAHSRTEQFLEASSKNQELQNSLNNRSTGGRVVTTMHVVGESGKIVGLSLWQFLTGKKRLETPEETHARIWSEKDQAILLYAQGILEPDEEVLRHSHIHWESGTDRIKWAFLAALVCFPAMLALSLLFPRGSVARELVSGVGMACFLFMIIGAPLWHVWASNIMQGCGCVVTNRRIIIRHNFSSLLWRDHYISHIPLDKALEVIVSQRKRERKADTGTIRIRCAGGADIIRLTYALEGNEANAYPLPERERRRLKNAALSWPLHHVREPFALKEFIESRIHRRE